MHTKALPYVGLLSFFWGTNVVASRYGVGQFDPLTFAALRLVIASTTFWLVFMLQRRTWPGTPRVWGHAAVSGVLGVTIPMTLFILSLQYQSAGVASIYVTVTPAIMAIAAHMLLPDERLSVAKAAGVGLALAGSLFLALRGESGLADIGRASPLGFILVFVGVSAEVLNAIFVRRRMRGMDPIPVTGIRLATAAAVTGTLALAFGDMHWSAVTPVGYASLFYAALIGALAGQFMAFYITRRFGATAFSLTAYLLPVVATTLGVILLGEIVTPGMMLGVLLIFGGIYLINRPARPVYA